MRSPRWSVSRIGVLALLIALPFLIGFSPAVFMQSGSVGSFEIDGNLVDNPAGEPLDWSLDPAGNTPNPALTNRTDFLDGSGQGDGIFGQGTKELEPGAWTCVTGSAPPKGDILKGSIAFRSSTRTPAARPFRFARSRGWATRGLARSTSLRSAVRARSGTAQSTSRARFQAWGTARSGKRSST